MIAGYGYRRLESALRDAGADTVWIDVSPERPERADMMRDGALRPGDTVIILAVNDLGGSKRANDQWRAMLAEKGVTVEVRAPDEPPAKMGRPRKFDPTPEQNEMIRALWLDPYRPGVYKIRRASEIMGREVKRGQLYHRYGSLDKPK